MQCKIQARAAAVFDITQEKCVLWAHASQIG